MEGLVDVPGQLFSSSCLFRISIDRSRDDVLFEPGQPGFKIFKLLLDIIELLQSMSATRKAIRPTHTS